MVNLAMANRTREELALGYLRYEVVRKLSPRAFRALYKLNLSGHRFDDLVDEAIRTHKLPTELDGT